MDFPAYSILDSRPSALLSIFQLDLKTVYYYMKHGSKYFDCHGRYFESETSQGSTLRAYAGANIQQLCLSLIQQTALTV